MKSSQQFESGARNTLKQISMCNIQCQAQYFWCYLQNPDAKQQELFLVLEGELHSLYNGCIRFYHVFLAGPQNNCYGDLTHFFFINTQ